MCYRNSNKCAFSIIEKEFVLHYNIIKMIEII